LGTCQKTVVTRTGIFRETTQCELPTSSRAALQPYIPWWDDKCTCVGGGDTGLPESCTEPGVYDYVICPWAPGDSPDVNGATDANGGVAGLVPTLQQGLGKNSNLHTLGYCNPGSNAPSTAAPTSATWGVIYEMDPGCPTCLGCPGKQPPGPPP
jgi:hypothetical protein